MQNSEPARAKRPAEQISTTLFADLRFVVKVTIATSRLNAMASAQPKSSTLFILECFKILFELTANEIFSNVLQQHKSN